MNRFFLVSIFASLVCSQTASAQFATPELHGFTQTAFTAGTESVIRSYGSNLDEPIALIEHSPAVSGICVRATTSVIGGEPQPTGEIRLDVESNAAPGLVPVRVHGRFGVSNPVNLLVVNSPVAVVNDDLSNVASARALAPGNIYDVKLLPAKSSYFRIDLAAGDQLRVGAYVEPTHSDAIVRCVVRDPAGRELTTARSTRRWPAEVDLVASTPGSYTIALSDFLNRGGDLYRVALEVGVGPTGQPPVLELDRLLRPDLEQVRPSLIHDSIATAYAFATKWPASSQPTTSTEQAPTEPTPVEAIPELPLSRIVDLSAGMAEVDFQASAGQRLIIEARSKQLEQLTDSRIELFHIKPDEAPVRLAQNDDRPFIGASDLRIRGFDPLLDWTAPEAGNYRVRVSDNGSAQSSAGVRSSIVSVAPYAQRFGLLAASVFPHKDRNLARPMGARLMKGDRHAIRVVALRQPGFQSAIEIRAEGLPEFLTCEPVVIAPNMTESALTIAAGENATDWVGSVQIIGRPLDANQQPLNDAAVTALIATVQNPKSTHRNAIETALADQLVIGVSSQDLAPIAVQLGNGTRVEVAQGGTAKIPVSVTRRAGGINDCVLRAQNLPPKVKQGDVTAPKDKSSVEFDLKIPSDLPPGLYSFWMQGETKVKWRRNPESLTRAQSHLEQLTKSQSSPAPNVDKAKLEAEIKAHTAAVEELRKQTAEKDITIWVPTNPLQINVVPAKSG